MNTDKKQLQQCKHTTKAYRNHTFHMYELAVDSIVRSRKYKLLYETIIELINQFLERQAQPTFTIKVQLESCKTYVILSVYSVLFLHILSKIFAYATISRFISLCCTSIVLIRGPTSQLFGFQPNFIVYTCVMRAHKCVLHTRITMSFFHPSVSY